MVVLLRRLRIPDTVDHAEVCRNVENYAPPTKAAICCYFAKKDAAMQHIIDRYKTADYTKNTTLGLAAFGLNAPPFIVSGGALNSTHSLRA